MIPRNLTNIDMAYQTMVGISAGTIANGFSRLLVRLVEKKDLIKLENNDSVEKMLQENRFDNDMMIVFICPAIEEIFFRGIIQPGIQFGLQQLDISSDLAKAISFLSTDIAFAAMHSGQASKFAALVGGLAYGSLALKYEGNIIPSVIAHMTYNFISTFKYRINNLEINNALDSNNNPAKVLKKNVNYQVNKNTLFQSQKNNLNNFDGAELDLTDLELAKSIFGQASNKAKKLKR